MNKKFNLLTLLIIISLQSCIKDKKVIVEINNILSEGVITNDSLRDGFWEYKNKKGEFLTKGNYENGLMKGKWEYKDLQYNNTHFVDWTVNTNNSFKLCLPSDWEIKKPENSPVHTFFYFDTEKWKPNGNITFIDAENKNMDIIIQDIISPYKESMEYKFLFKKRVSINKTNGYEINQSLKFDGKDVFSKIFILKNKEDVFLLTFLCQYEDIKLYNQLFTEIAYTFRQDIKH